MRHDHRGRRTLPAARRSRAADDAGHRRRQPLPRAAGVLRPRPARPRRPGPARRCPPRHHRRHRAGPGRRRPARGARARPRRQGRQAGPAAVVRPAGRAVGRRRLHRRPGPGGPGQRPRGAAGRGTTCRSPPARRQRRPAGRRASSRRSAPVLPDSRHRARRRRGRTRRVRHGRRRGRRLGPAARCRRRRPVPRRWPAGSVLTVLIDNDARAQALGEKWFGDARGLSTFASVATGTGLGVGLVLRRHALPRRRRPHRRARPHPGRPRRRDLPLRAVRLLGDHRDPALAARPGRAAGLPDADDAPPRPR